MSYSTILCFISSCDQEIKLETEDCSAVLVITELGEKDVRVYLDVKELQMLTEMCQVMQTELKKRN